MTRNVPLSKHDKVPGPWLFWGAVLVTSAAFRLWALYLLDGRAPDGDAPNYLAMAHNMLSGRGMVLDDANNVANMRATYPPLYPMLLASFGLLLPLSFATVTAVNSAIDLACAWAMTRLGAAAGDSRAGAAAAAIYLLWPTNMGMAPLARKEGLVALFVVALLLVLVRSIEEPRRKDSVRLGAIYGVLTGLLALTQPGLLFLPALFALVALPKFRSRREWLMMMSVGAACAALTLLPWWIRNWLLFHRFVPLTAASGYSLWIGATPIGDGTWIQPPPKFLAGDEFAMAAGMGQEAQRIIASDTSGYVLHCLEKFGRAMASENRGATMIHWAEPRAHYWIARGWVAIATTAHFIALQTAIICAVLRRREMLSKFLFAAFAQILLFAIWFEFDQRHRYFLTPLLLLVAASGVRHGLLTRSGASILSAR